MKRRLFALALGLVLLLSGCEQPPAADSPALPPEDGPAETSPEPEAAREFALAWDETAPLHPLETDNAVNLALAGLVYEGLFQVGEGFEAEKVLCSSYWVSDDGLAWTFTLRSGVFFSDGTPLEPRHVADSLNLARASALYASRLAGVTSVTASEEGVVVSLTAPNGTLPLLLDIPVTLDVEDGIGWVEPEESDPPDESASPSTLPQPPLGTGPYRCDADGDALVLRKNGYWRQAASLPVDEIPLRATSTADQRVAAFDTGLTSVVTSDPTGSTVLGYSCDYETWDFPTTSMVYLGFQCQSEFCKDELLRQAIARCVDREMVTDTLLAGHADAAALPLSPHASLYDDALAAQLDYDPEAAAALLSAAGYTVGEDGVLYTARRKAVELELLVNTDNAFRLDIAEHVAGELAKLGLSVTVTALPWEEFLLALERGDFDLYLAQVRMTADFDPAALLFGTLNYGLFADRDAEGEPLRWNETGVAEALLSAAKASSGDGRAAAWAALYAHLAERAPFVPICFTRSEILTRWGLVTGASPTAQNIFYQFIHWEMAL